MLIYVSAGQESIQISNAKSKHCYMPMSLSRVATTANSTSPAPEYPWQYLGAGFFQCDGLSTSLSLTNTPRCYHLQDPCIPMQCCKEISIMKELFADCWIPESLCTDNCLQIAHALFVEFFTDWKFDHNTSAPRNPGGNGQAEAAVNIVKGLLTHAKCSVQIPYLALLTYCSTPLGAHFCSPAELLYQWAYCPTVQMCIQNTDPHTSVDYDHFDGMCLLVCCIS